MWCGDGSGAGVVGSGGRFGSYSCLFNDAVSSLGYRGPSYWMAVKEELERLCKKAAMA